MRSGTSYFNWPVFRKTITRFWPLWAAYSVIWMIILPLNGLFMLQYQNRFGADYMEDFAYSTVPSVVQAVLPFSVIFGVLCAMAVFSHLYNARSANFYGSLPVRREGMFLTHYLAGLAFLIVPNVLVFLLTLLVELAGGTVCMQGLLFWLGAACGEAFFFYSLAVFCGMFTGHILALPAFYVIINFLGGGVLTLIHGLLQMFYYGFSRMGNWVTPVTDWLTPTMNLSDNLGSHFGYSHTLDGIVSDNEILTTYGLEIVGVYALVAVVLVVIAFFLYRTRRLESAGDVVSVRPMRPVFKYGLAICAGVGLGFITTYILSLGKIGLSVAILLWGVVGYFAAQMLLDKSFKVFRKWKGAAVMAAAFLAVFAVMWLDLTGFETRIPAVADVESVEVDGLYGCYLDDSGDRLAYQLISDPQQIEYITILHQTALDKRDNILSWNDGSDFDAENWTNTGMHTLIYHLKNGSTMERRYNNVWLDARQVNQEGTGAWAMEQLYRDRDFYWQVYGFDTLEAYLSQGWRLERVEYRDNRSDYREEEPEYEEWPDQYAADTESSSSEYFYTGDARALLDAVKEDFWAGRIGVRHVGASYSGMETARSLHFWAVSNEDPDRGCSIRICVQDTASSTLAVLDKLPGIGNQAD